MASKYTCDSSDGSTHNSGSELLSAFNKKIQIEIRTHRQIIQRFYIICDSLAPTEHKSRREKHWPSNLFFATEHESSLREWPQVEIKPWIRY